MHELSVAMELVDIASEAIAKHGTVEVTAVRVTLGPFAGVAKDALLFSFDLAAAGTPLEGAQLVVEEVPAVVWCEPCRAERELDDVTRRRCPACQTPAPRLIRGSELEIVGLEVCSA